MRNDEIYDSQGQDGIDNKKAFDRLPKIFKYFISTQQQIIFDKVCRNVAAIHSDSALKDIVKTSGFRSPVTTARHGGVSDSLHHFGLAIDFRKTGIFSDRPIPVCCDFECIDSGDVWHIQFKRK